MPVPPADMCPGYSIIGVAREGQRGAIAPPKMPQSTFLTKKVAPNFYFSAQKPAGGLTAAIHGSGVPPPPSPRRVPPPRQIPGYALYSIGRLSVADFPVNK